MDRNIWMNRSRRPTINPERSTNSKGIMSVKKTLPKYTGGLCVNKENENRGAKRNILSGRTLNSKNDRQQTKEESSRRSITRRLSFHKIDREFADESPFHCVGSRQDVSISSVTFNENFQDVDESMLCPMNSTSVMGSDPSPFRLDLHKKGEQKIGFPSIEKQFNDCIMSDSNNKLGLSDETKKMLKDMGIDTSPDVGKHDYAKNIPRIEVKEISGLCYAEKETQTTKQPHTNKVSEKSSGVSEFLAGNYVEKDTQTTPQIQIGAVGCKSTGESNALASIMMTLNNIYFRHFQEREELSNKQKKEVEEFMSFFKETYEGDKSKPNGNLRSGDESRTSMPQPEASVEADKNAVQSVGIEVSSISQAPLKSLADASWELSPNINQQSVPEIIASTEESTVKLNSFLPPQNYVVPAGSAPYQTTATNFDIDKVQSSEAIDVSGERENAFLQHNWRRQEVSLIETPQAGRWLVIEDLEKDNLMSNTPTLGLNSMLQGMSIEGQQSLMETPATRRLVTKRILKGVESLFY